MSRLHATLTRELTHLGLPDGPGGAFDRRPITEADLEPLPAPARRYLRFERVVGRARDWSFRLGMTGRFRRSRDEAWMRCEAWQYNSAPATARVFYLRLRLWGLVPVIGRDTYVAGRGRMLVRPFDLVTIADGQGEPYDVGELVTYLNDAVLLAPTMLLAPGVAFAPVDDDAFDVSLTDHGRTVRARVFVDERGAPVDFETTDRYYADPKDPTRTFRCRWTTPVASFVEVDGRMLPAGGQAVWHPPDGPLAYADFVFDPATLAFDVAPAAA